MSATSLFSRWLNGVACLLLGLALGCGPALPPEVAEAYEQLPAKIDFNYHIRPILSDRCWSCHGPDANSRKAGLRLDTEAGAFAALESGGHAVDPGSLSGSHAFLRLLSDDPETVMPPPEANLSLSPQEIAYIAKWIEQGAEWKAHWAFIPPERPSLPNKLPADWARHNEIDPFVQAKLREQGLTPSPPADKTRLLRRLTFDLTGLPPAPAEVDAFLADNSPEAYEKVVDRLLASDAYAERMAMEWMDVARYADSHGLHADGWRNMWPWRDWVIDAFRQNLPYDQFITEQLAGDLLPEPSQQQILATAFNRNHPMTGEGGAIDEEFRLEYVFDRSNTVATAVLGMTMECARCHDHKYDPISQQEYYQFSAFFNNLRDLGMTGDDGNYGPNLSLHTDSSRQALARLERAIAEGKQTLATLEDEAQVEAIKSYLQKGRSGPKWTYPFDRWRVEKEEEAFRSGKLDGNAEARFSGRKLELVPGHRGQALAFNSGYDRVNLHDVPNFEAHQPFSGMLWAKTRKREPLQTQTLMGTSGNKNNFWRGWDFFLDSLNRPTVRLIHQLPLDMIEVRARDSVVLGQWQHLAFSYDGSGQAAGLQLFIGGQPAEAEVLTDHLTRSIHPVSHKGFVPETRPVQLARSYRSFTGEDGIFAGEMDELQLYDRALLPEEVPWEAGLSQPEPENPAHARTLARLARQQQQDYQQQAEALAELRAQRMALLNSVPTVMVMREMETPRTMHVLDRGVYDQPLEPVQPGTPAHILPFGEDLPPNRLGLAQWLFDERHPLTARVVVNRYWQLFFGQGLVKTAHDFGNQGELPSHPALLDWLAVNLRESGWDLRALHKQIVMSATYRQASRFRPELKEKDPENRFLARGPSQRLPAEMIRDNALAASGLLADQVGGESVFPPQPEGLWKEKSTFSYMLLEYQPDSGAARYRRSLYTFIRRTSPPPFLNLFDAPNRDRCVVQREVTNTPLQALVLLNDPQFLEAARVLAQRSQREAGPDLDAQLKYAFRRVTSRWPSEKELPVFQRLFEQEQARFRDNPASARDYLAAGPYPLPDSLATPHTAALAVVASTMLNHDEAYMKR